MKKKTMMYFIKKTLVTFVLMITVLLLIGCGKKEYTISYQLNGGNCEQLITVYRAGEAVELPIPELSNYTFLGWYSNGVLFNEFTEGNLELEAKWIHDLEMFDENYFVYDGTVKKMVIDVTLPDIYEVSYKNNENTNVGKYYVMATLKDKTGKVVKTLKNTMIIDVPKNEEFAKEMDDLLIEMFEGDQLSVNFFFKDYSLYGIEHSEAKLSHFDMSTYEEDVIENEEFIKKLKAYDVDTLNLEQKDCLEYILYLFENSSKYTEEMNYMTNGYLGSYLGYQANLPLELAEYKFYTEQDVIDFLGYLEDAPAAFKTYFDFTVAQAEKGYGMTDTVISNVVSQCEKFVEIKETNYLIDIFNDKVDAVDFLSDDKKAEYKVRAKELIQGSLTDAYKYIQDNLPTLKGKATNTGGLARFGEEGKKLYEIMLQGELGFKDLTGDQAIEYIEGKLIKYYDLMNAVERDAQTKGGSIYLTFSNVTEGNIKYSTYKYDELLGYYKEAADKFVPPLKTQPEISINYVPKSLEENFSPACYFVSPLDVKNKESIYLNGAYTDDYNYVFITMAHEGYPGHLYQYSYAKELDIHNIRKVIRNSGYTEGWATYMEINAYDFAVGFDTEGHQLAVEYMKYSDIFWGLINVRIDLGIHYEGWTIKQLVNYMNDFFGYPSSAGYQASNLRPAFNQMVEIPTNVSKYFYAFSLLNDMREKAVEELGDSYNEVLFNKCLLDYGALHLEMLQEKVDEFIADQKALASLQ